MDANAALQDLLYIGAGPLRPIILFQFQLHKALAGLLSTSVCPSTVRLPASTHRD